ncbi:MAG: tetratricopeptide repeat protein [Acidobacteria bacterium]|nr:tetratricopeptide repeat protein [Acidobacteriota bacterium]
MKLIGKRGRAASIVVLSATLWAGAATTDPEGLNLWKDPDFQKSFLGGYGVNSNIEPALSAVERDTLQKEVMPLLAEDKLDEAAAKLREIIVPGSSAMLDYTLGQVYLQKEQMTDALDAYKRALAKFPSYLRAHKNVGMIAVREARYSDAIEHLSRVIELGGADGVTYGLLGFAYSSSGFHVPAESAFRNALLLDRDTLDWKLGLTQSVIKQDKFGEAITLCEELIARDPGRADFWLLQANAYIGIGQPLKAAYNYEIIDRLGKATVGSLSTLGDIYVNEELYDLASRAYGRAFEIDASKSLDKPLRWIDQLARRGAVDEAKSLIARVESVAGTGIDAEQRKKLLKLKARIGVQEGTSSESVGVLEELVSLDPLDGDALILLGQHYASHDDQEKAIFYYERAAQIEAFEADAKIRHAQVLVGLARYKEAVPLLKRALELKPSEQASRYLEQVERLARSQK